MKQLQFCAFVAVLFVLIASVAAQEKRAATPSVEEATKVSSSLQKSAMRILFVGFDPNLAVNVPSYVTGPAAGRMAELKQERMSAFQTLLESHFESVTCVNSQDYLVAMSDDYDVTVFDVLPPPIEIVDMGTWKKKVRIPLDFDRPSLLIGEVGPLMLGRLGRGLRLDHL